MKVKLNDWLSGLSGSMGKDYYASPLKNEPGWCVIRRKPGPRNPKGKRHDLWVMPEAQQQTVSSFRSNQAQAKQIYHNPVERAKWEADYQNWLVSERKRGKLGNMLHGRHVRHLWDFLRIRLSDQQKGTN